MKGVRWLTVLLLVALCALRPVAQAAHTVYLPVAAQCGDYDVGYWHFIRPEGTRNLVVNPSFEQNLTDGWANYATGAAGGTRTRLGLTTDAKFGAYYVALVKNAGAQNDQWGLFDTLTVTSTLNSTYVMSAWVWSDDANVTIHVVLNKSAGVGVLQTVSVTHTGTTDDWVRLETPVLTANATGDNLVAFVYITGTPTRSAGFDAVQVEIQSEATTYADGDQLGCEWLGAEHNSVSQRSDQSRAGGLVVDFDDMNFDIEGMIGAGMSPITLNVDSYAILPGGELNSQKTEVRPFSLTGWVRGTSLEDLHAKRQALIDEFKPNARATSQPVVLRYTGADVTKEINAYYQAGLEGRIRGDFVCLEQNFALRFLATDPDFYEIGESSAVLDSLDQDVAAQTVAARLVETGQWDDLGPPNAAGTYNNMNAVIVNRDRTVFYGGDFRNFDNIAAADAIVQYTPSTSTWAAVGNLAPGAAEDVFGFALSPNDDLYLFGDFNNAGGVANADKIAMWDGAAYNAVGNPALGGLGNTIRKGAFAANGDLYVVGDFANMAGIANADRVAMWDGAAWNAVGIPLAGAAVINSVRAVAIDGQGNVYVGGDFTTFANITGADYIAMWDGTNWNQIVQLNGVVQEIVIDEQDNVYLTGNFTDAGGEANADHIAVWNGQAMQALGTGFDAQALDLAFGPDGVLYAAGQMTTAGGLTLADPIAKWTGGAWAALDEKHDAVEVRCIVADLADPVVPTNYNLWLGFSNSAAVNLYYAGLVTVTNNGTEEAYPRFQITRTAATNITDLYSIRNETTGKELNFYYALLNGETLTIDLRPTQKSIVSNFFGRRQVSLLANSDFGDWSLMPGDNDVSCFIWRGGGVANNTIEMLWRAPFWSAD